MPDSVRTAPRRGGCVTAEAQNTALDDFGGLLDWQRLNDWIAERPEIPGSGLITGASRLAGGLPNAVFRLERGPASFVLRRPSKLVRDGSNQSIPTEARIPDARRATVGPQDRHRAA